jgi:hypothetical protein
MQPVTIPEDTKSVAADTVHGRFDHGQGDRGGHCRIHGVAAMAQDFETGLNRKRLRACHHILAHGWHALGGIGKLIAYH